MITINNNSYSGRNIVIKDGKVFVDGTDVTPDSKEITVSVIGDLENLEIDHAKTIEIKGNIGKVRSGSGDVNCERIGGDVQTGSGDVECSYINGSVQTGSGDVKSNTIIGSVKTGSGDIKYRKSNESNI
jgi:hypothetical protein